MRSRFVSLSIVAVVTASVSLILLRFANQESSNDVRARLSTQASEMDAPAYFGNPWKTPETTAATPYISLSPSARYVAALCPAKGVPAPTTATNGTSALSRKKELVIWRVRDRTEVAREAVTSVGNIVWTRGENGLAVGSDIWYWKSEKLIPTSGIMGASPNASARWMCLEGDLYLEQLYPDRTSMRALQLSTGNEVKLFPHVVRRLQNLPPNGDTAPAFNPERFVLSPNPFNGSVRVVMAQEDVGAQRPFSSSLHTVVVGAWDLVAGRKLWQWKGKYRYSVPSLLWSPDGKRLAIVGTLSPDPDTLKAMPDAKIEDLPEDRLGDQGIQILDGATGRGLYSFRAMRFGGSPNATNSRWAKGFRADTFVLDDWTWISHPGGPSEKQHLLRLFNGGEAKQWDVTQQWDVEDSAFSGRMSWDMSDDGHAWALGTVRDGLWVFKLPD